jgi:transcriptional regulator with XRE-family HTH domain
MTDISDGVIVSRLRQILEDEKIKLTEVSVTTGIPYRTLQNQLAGKSRISAINLLKILDATGIPSTFLTEESATVNIALLTMSLETVLGERVPHIETDEVGEFVVTLPADRSKKQIREDAFALAIALEREYGVLSVHMSGGFRRMLSDPDDTL